MVENVYIQKGLPGVCKMVIKRQKVRGRSSKNQSKEKPAGFTIGILMCVGEGYDGYCDENERGELMGSCFETKRSQRTF